MEFKRFRMVPANGTPLSVRDLWSIFCLLITKRNQDCHSDSERSEGEESLVEAFEKAFSDYIGVKYSFACSSGRAAMYIALKVLSSLLPEKREVIIPVYTCQSVLFSVLRAGLTPVYCDVTKDTFNLDITKLSSLVSEKTLCVILAYMFGYPCDIEKIMVLADKATCYVIEDVAQSCGAEWNRRKLGSFGDISFFSFGPSKNFTTVKGGMICTSSEGIAELLRKEIDTLKSPGLFTKFLLLTMFIAHYVVIKPFFFNILTKSHIKFTETEFSQNFRVEKLTNFQGAIGTVLLKLLDTFNAIRTRNEKILLQSVPSFSNKLAYLEDKHLKAVCLRLPLIIKNQRQHDVLVKKFLRKGIWARSTAYVPLNLLQAGSSFGEKGAYSVAESIYDSVVIIPTHPYLSDDDIKNSVGILRDINF